MTKPRTKRKTLAEKIEHNADAIRRWEGKVKRAINALARLTRERTRLQRLAAQQPATPPAKPGMLDQLVAAATALPATAPPTPVETPAPASAWKPGELEAAVAVALGDHPLDPPAFLRRSQKDQAAIEAAKAERVERGKRKRQGQEATRKARRAGETRRMPLTGKAALAAIRGE